MRLCLRLIVLLLLASSLIAEDRHSGDEPEENFDSVQSSPPSPAPVVHSSIPSTSPSAHPSPTSSLSKPPSSEPTFVAFTSPEEPLTSAPTVTPASVGDREAGGVEEGISAPDDDSTIGPGGLAGLSIGSALICCCACCLLWKRRRDSEEGERRETSVLIEEVMM